VIEIQPGQTVAPLPKPGARTIGRGTQAGVVYRLANGQLVYVQQAAPPEEAAEWGTSGTQLRSAVPLIWQRERLHLSVTWVTIKVAVVSTTSRS
jgi:hypothetical protein